jgi:methionyl-tRNA formyltransferase
MKQLKIGYFADGPWSHEAFKLLIKDSDIKISFICVRADTQDDILKEYCVEHKIDYLKHQNINSKEFIDVVSKYCCDLFVSMSFNQIFRKEIINLPKLKMINCHAGNLPFYRGRNILNWALINDEKEFGITVHFIDEGIDTGDIILQRTYPISEIDDYSTLLKVAYIECAVILYDAIALFKNGRVESKKQSEIHPTGFYCSQRGVGDEILDWGQSSRDIFNFVRAICRPGPMARAFLNGKEMYINKIDYIKSAPDYKCKVGVILQKNDDGLLVKTKDSFVKVSEFIFDDRIKVGDKFEIR